MAKTANDIAKETYGNLMMQITLLAAENEQLREENEKLKSEQLKAKQDTETKKNGTE